MGMSAPATDDTVKHHLIISLVALQPAARALLRTARRPASSASAPFVASPPLAPDLPGPDDNRWDLHDETGHHRYYGRSACL